MTTTDSLQEMKAGLQELVKRAQQNLVAEVEAGRLDFDKISPRHALLREMERLAKEDMQNDKI